MVRLIYAIIVLIIIGIIYYARRRKSDNTEAPQDTSDNTTIQQVSAPTEIPVVIVNNGVRTEGILKMAQGLRVYDANGNVILDVTDRITKYLGELDTGYNDGELSNPDITDGVSVWVFATSYSYNNTVTSGTHVCATPQFTCSAGKIMWTFPEGDVRASLHVMYGVY